MISNDWVDNTKIHLFHDLHLSPMDTNELGNKSGLLTQPIDKLFYVGLKRLLFHDLLLSPISQHSVWSEITSHNRLH